MSEKSEDWFRGYQRGYRDGLKDRERFKLASDVPAEIHEHCLVTREHPKHDWGWHSQYHCNGNGEGK